MVPFRVYDRERKFMLIVLNFHPGDNGGSYLAACETDQDNDGEILTISAIEMKKYKFVDFLEPSQE